MGFSPEKLLFNLLQVNGLRDFPGPGDLGRVGRKIDPKPAFESPQTGGLPRIRPASGRRTAPEERAAVDHGRVAVIAWLSDSTAAGRGQAGSEVGEAPAMATIRKPPHRCARTPAMTTPTTTSLLPSHWQPAAAAGPVVDVTATACLS